MAREYNYIEQITPLKENMTIKIRIVRLWKPPSYNNPNEDGSIEMVFLDEKGGKIQASVKKSLIGRFSNVLEEGQLRMITNFGVGQSTGNYKPTQHPYKINFFFTTIVDVCDNLPIPRYGFNFVSFDTILSKQMDDTSLVDVIGQIAVVGPLETNDINGRPSKKIMMELTDNKSAKLKCTLWDTFAEEVANYISERGSSPIIMIIQFAKIKEWKGEITLSNSMFSTRLFFDEDIDEVNSFKSSLQSTSENALLVRHPDLSSQSSVSITNEFLKLHERKSLDEIRDINIPTHCITLATIVCVQLEHGWYYLACKKCNKKVTMEGVNVSAESGDAKTTMFNCKKCEKSLTPENVIPRYKVRVRVVDESGSASFVMFDREVISIVKKTAYDFKASLQKDDDESYPEELNDLVGRKILFKVEISDYNINQNWRVYTITKMSDNQDLIQSYLSSATTNQDVSSDSTSFSNLGKNTADTMDKDSVSFMGDNDQLSDLSPICSIKRQLEIDSSELSTTKKNIKVKIEKDEN